uniref:Trihelix transcription factor GT-1 n=1 Tax=Schizaphis graminum TaxID=13262 RepID=A0A2S2NDE6_SCHGA
MPETKTWTAKAIKLLIANRGDLEYEFNSNKKNHKIWEKISNILKENGITMSGQNCNTKFRNLMATFRDNVQRANKSGEGAINWEYYVLMKQYFGKKDSVTPNQNTLLESSLPNSSKTSLNIGKKTDEHTKMSKPQHPQLLHSIDEEINSDEDIIPKRKKKKNFQEILLEEMKEDRKARDSFQNKLENFMDKLIQIETAKLDKM